MVRSTLALLATSFAGVLGFAQTQPVIQPVSQTAASVPWANKFFQKENTPSQIVHDFGTVPSGTLLQHTFKITNIYDVPMQVVYVRKSCSCLEAYPPTTMIAPNETAELKVTMDSAKFKGSNSQTFNVTFGPNYISTAIIQVKAVSRADVQINPGTVNFGTIAQGNTANQNISIKYLGRQRDWKVTEVGAVNGPFDATLDHENKLFNGEWKVNIALKKDAPAGPINGVIQLKTNDPSSPILPVTVSANIQAPFTISPAKASFSKVAVGQSSTLRIMVRSVKPFTIEAYTDESTGISAEPALAAAAPVQVVNVKVSPKTVGVIRAELRLRTNQNGALVNIPIEIEAVQP